jgi:hypothetical protein
MSADQHPPLTVEQGGSRQVSNRRAEREYRDALVLGYIRITDALTHFGTRPNVGERTTRPKILNEAAILLSRLGSRQIIDLESIEERPIAFDRVDPLVSTNRHSRCLFNLVFNSNRRA